MKQVRAGVFFAALIALGCANVCSAAGQSIEATAANSVSTVTNGAAAIAGPWSNWIRRATGTAEYNRVIFANGRFVAVSWDGTTATSTNGAAWTFTKVAQEGLGVAYGSGRFVMVGRSLPAHSPGSALQSTDGVTWTPISLLNPAQLGVPPHLSAIAFGAGRFVAVGESGVVFVSPDGISWTRYQTPAVDQLNGIHFADGLFVAVGGSRVFSSTDGIVWVDRTPSSPESFLDVTHFKGRWYITSWFSFRSSGDLTSWTQTFLPLGRTTLVDLEASHGVLLGVGPGRNLSVSTNGTQWESLFLEGSNQVVLTSAATGNNTVVAVGYEGAIYQNIQSAADLLTITTQPVSAAALAGSRVDFFVTASSTTSLSYQWQVSTNAGATWTNLTAGAEYAGVNGASLTLLSTSSSQNGYRYRCVVSNAVGSTASAPAVLSLPGFSVSSPPRITAVPLESPRAIGVTASSSTPLTYQWRKNGIDLPGAVQASLSAAGAPSSTGLYSVKISNGVNEWLSQDAMLGVYPVYLNQRIMGADLIGSDIQHPNGNVYDQVLLKSSSALTTPDPGQIQRMSFMDTDGDIVQLEFSGSGILTVNLNPQSYGGIVAPTKYNQPSMVYARGHASISIMGADESTHLSIFTVGRMTAVDQTLFRPGETYDGVADIAFVAISSVNGRFGGLRAANAEFFGDAGYVGVHAPDVQFFGPVYVGNVSATGDATPFLLTGRIETGEIRIAGGDLFQPNGRGVRVGGVDKVAMTAGTNSHGVVQAAQKNRGRIERYGENVTAQVVQDPSP